MTTITREDLLATPLGVQKQGQYTGARISLVEKIWSWTKLFDSFSLAACVTFQFSGLFQDFSSRTAIADLQ